MFKKIFSFALKEMKAQRKIQTFLVLNLAFGLLGFFVLQVFQGSLMYQTQTKAKEILGGDFAISARKVVTSDEIQNFEKNIFYTQKTRVVNFFGMLKGAENSRLVSVRAVEQGYPLYGKLELEGEALSFEENKIWTDPEVVTQLKIMPGQTLRLGQADFKFAGIIKNDPTRTFRPGGFAPVVMVSLKFLPQTELIQNGSTVSYSWLYRLKQPEAAAQIKSALDKQILDPSIRFDTTSQDGDGGNRVLKYFSDYLGLVSLVALGLCFLCGGYLLRWIFQTQRKNIAIYKTLGLQEFEMIWIQLIKNTLLSLIAFGVALIIVLLALPVLQKIINEKFNLPLDLRLDMMSVLITGGLSILVPQLMSFPLTLELLQLQPKELFQTTNAQVKRTWLFWIWITVSVLLFWLLTISQSQSFKTGTIFTFGLVGVYLLFKMGLYVLLKFLDRIANYFPWRARYALKGLTRQTQSTDLVFVTMSLSLLVLGLLPHIKTSLIEEIRPSNPSQIPALFLFDIQPEQVRPLQDITKSATGIELQMTPLVRSRILKVNDLAYERFENNNTFTTREQEEETRFRNRGVNLTYKSKLQDSEKVVAGKWNEKPFAGEGLPEISLEERYASRIGAGIGDIMHFDVQGLPIQAKVTSLRTVRWTSFQPNFFILFQPGVLEEAPQVFLTSLPKLTDEQVNAYQNEVVTKLPNVSIINVKQTVENSLVFIDQMSLALEGMAILSIVVGLFVFIILLNTQLRERLNEMNLLQILGLSNSSVSTIIRYQFLILVVLALVAGLSLGLLGARLIMTTIFDISTYYDMSSLLQMTLILIPLSLVVLYFGLRPLSRLNPMDLIRQA